MFRTELRSTSKLTEDVAGTLGLTLQFDGTRPEYKIAAFLEREGARIAKQEGYSGTNDLAPNGGVRKV